MCDTSSNGLSLFIALRAKVQVQHMMVRYVYTSRTARLRNRIAISYHQNSKHESLPTGCFLGLCLFYHASSTVNSCIHCTCCICCFKPQATKTTCLIRAIRIIRVPIKQTHPCSNQSLNTKHSCSLSKTCGTYIRKRNFQIIIKYCYFFALPVDLSNYF